MVQAASARVQRPRQLISDAQRRHSVRTRPPRSFSYVPPSAPSNGMSPVASQHERDLGVILEVFSGMPTKETEER